MKVANIALFKRFLTEHGVNTIFKGLYNQYHFEENPEGVEDYLKQVDCQNVILTAFKFPKTMDNYRFGQDYWTGMAVKWETLVGKMTKEGYYNTFHKAVERYQREAETPLERFNKGLRDIIKKRWQEQMQEEEKKQQPETVKIPTAHEKTVITESGAVQSPGLRDFGSFEYFDLSKKSSPKMQEDEFSISSKKGSYKLTFNKRVTEQISMAGLKNFRIGQDKITGEVRILFGNFEDGMEFTISKSTNLTIANKSLVGILTNVFGLKEALTTLYLSRNLANSKDYIVFRITKERQ